MHDLSKALVIIFCTPLGWMGMLCCGIAVGQMRRK
jgi:hypothetical protein